MSDAREKSVRGKEKEQWITKTSVLPYLFSFLLDLLSPLFVLQAILFSPSLHPSSSSLFLFPSPCFPICRSSTVSLLPLVHDYCLLLFASPSVSISFTQEPPGVFCSLLILSDFSRQTLYKRSALFWTWPCTASFHTLQTPLSLRNRFRRPSGSVQKGPPRAKERRERSFTLNIPTLSWWRYFGVGHSRETLGLGTPGVGRPTKISGVGHSENSGV